MRQFLFIAIGVGALLGTGSANDRSTLVEDPARPDVLVSTRWLADNLGHKDLVVIHVGAAKAAAEHPVRTRYRDRHIPGARHLPWNRLVTDRDGLKNELPRLKDLTRTVRDLGIDKGKRIVLYDTGMGLESARAYVTFDYLGLGHRTSLLDGQWKEWVREERPATAAVPSFTKTTFVPGRTGPVFINWATLRSMIYTGDPYGVPLALFDARPMAEYSGTRAGRGVGRPGHIPYAESVPWDDMLADSGSARFRPKREMARLFEAFGARPGCLVVTYCRTGVKASLLYVAAKHLGYRVRLYDGSFMEWSSLEDLPVIDGVWAE